MKAIKYFVIGALLSTVAAPTFAQDDAKSAVAQVTTILKSSASDKDKDKEIATVAKVFKKDAKTLAAIANEYFEAGNEAKAKEYANMALKAAKNACAEAYIVLGDIAVRNDNAGEAGQMFQQAMYMDKTNPAGYRRYAYLMAKASPASSIDAFNQMAQNVPGVDANLQAAEMFHDFADRERAKQYYGKTDINKLTTDQLLAYASDAFFTNDYPQTVEICEVGHKKNPRHPGFNRLLLFSYNMTKDFNKAAEAGNNLFNNSDDVKTNVMDFQNYGHALIGVENYDGAIKAFETVLTHADANNAAKIDAYKNISTAYIEKDEYDASIDAYNKFIDLKGDAVDVNDLAQLGNLYMIKGQKLEDTAAKEATLSLADEVMAKIATMAPEAEEYATYQRARIGSILDPEGKQGLAKPHYDRLIQIITAKGVDASSKNHLVQAYLYNMTYSYLIKKDKAEAKEFAAKLLEIEPTHERAKQILELK